MTLYHRHDDLLVGGVSETEHQEDIRQLLHRIGGGIGHAYLQYPTMLLCLTRHKLAEVVEHLTAVGCFVREAERAVPSDSVRWSIPS